jgi:hypothetical protein
MNEINETLQATKINQMLLSKKMKLKEKSSQSECGILIGFDSYLHPVRHSSQIF